MGEGLGGIVPLSTRMRFGLGFAVVSVVLFTLSYWQISSSLDEFADLEAELDSLGS